MNHAWTCSCCGKQHNTLQLDIAFNAPDHWIAIPEAEREHRGKIDSEVCFMDREYIFVRGVLEIPIIGLNDHFRWGAWVCISEESFRRMLELWTASTIENEPPKPGRLANNIEPSLYPNTLNLKSYLHPRGGNARPSIELVPSDHPLAVEQQQGISIARVEEIVSACHVRH